MSSAFVALILQWELGSKQGKTQNAQCSGEKTGSRGGRAPLPGKRVQGGWNSTEGPWVQVEMQHGCGDWIRARSGPDPGRAVERRSRKALAVCLVLEVF